MTIAGPVLFMLILGAIASGVLIIASHYLHVAADPRVDAIVTALPGVNCGACGFSSCMSAAEAVAEGKAGPGVCLIGGEQTTAALESIVGYASQSAKKKIAYLCCSRTAFEAGRKHIYNGPEDCFSAVSLIGGEKQCGEGCIGRGSCVPVCPINAITMQNGLPRIDRKKCTGCGLCVKTCPKKIIALINDEMSAIDRKRCGEFCMRPDVAFKVDSECCIACGLCKRHCPVEAIFWEKGVPAEIDREKCIECYTCLRVCPPGVIS